MIVGGLQGRDITLAQCAGILQIRASPRKPLPPEPQELGNLSSEVEDDLQCSLQR